MRSPLSVQRTYYLILFLYWLATALPMALAVLLIQARGLNLFQVGVLMGAYSLTIVLLEVPTGGLADAIGRKQVTVLAYGCLAVAAVLFLFAFSFPVFLLVFVLNGVGRALASGALDAWFVDALQAADPEIELQPALAQAGTISFLALGLGTLTGGFLPRLFSHLPAEGAAVLTPFAVPVVAAIAIRLILLPATILLVREERPAGAHSGWKQGFRRAPAMIRQGFQQSRRNPTIVRLLGVAFASGLAVLSLETLWQPHFAGLLGGSEGHSLFFGLVMGGNFLIGMAGNLLATPLSRLLRKRYALAAAIFQGSGGAFLILLAWQTSTPAAVLLFWLVYLNLGGANSPHLALLNREIPAEQRSSMLSIGSLATYLGAIAGSVGLGYVAEHVSINSAWIISGAILVVSLILYWQVDLHQRQTYGPKTTVLEAG